MRVVRADIHGSAAAAAVLRAGGVVVVPTDTVYGLAARPTDTDAVGAVYRIKGRPEGMPLPVLAASEEQVRALGGLQRWSPRTGGALVAWAAHPGVRFRPRGAAAIMARGPR